MIKTQENYLQLFDEFELSSVIFVLRVAYVPVYSLKTLPLLVFSVDIWYLSSPNSMPVYKFSFSFEYF